jgi:hypothetical protein
MLAAIDHFVFCSVGIHAVKIGDRFAALQPVAQGLNTVSKQLESVHAAFCLSRLRPNAAGGARIACGVIGG